MEVELRLDAIAHRSDSGYRRRALDMEEFKLSRCGAVTDRNRIADGTKAIVGLDRARESVRGRAFGVPVRDLHAAHDGDGEDAHQREAPVPPTAPS